MVFSCEFYEISKNAFFYRTPFVVASEVNLLQDLYFISSNQSHIKAKKRINDWLCWETKVDETIFMMKSEKKILSQKW